MKNNFNDIFKVDDVIVVVENVERLIRDRHLSAKDATSDFKEFIDTISAW